MEVAEVIKAFIQRFQQTFSNELKSIFRGFTHHWLLWILPLSIFILISSIFSKGVLFDLPVAYIDHDKSSLSRELIREFDAGAHARLVNYDSDLDAAVEDLKKAEVYALLYIPPHFEDDVLGAKQPTPVLYYNALYYGAGLYSIMDYSGLITELNTKYRVILANKVGLAMPELAKVNFIYDGLFNASGNTRYYQQFSAVVHLLQLFVVTITIHILGNLPRRTRPSYPSILGKLAPYTLWYTTLLLFEIALLVFFSDAKVNSLPIYMLVVGFFYVIAAQSIGILLFTYTKSTLTAYSLIGILVGLALTYSGIAVPEISMPLIAKVIAQIEPLTYALNTLFDIFLRNISLISVLKTCGILTIYPLFITLLVRKRLVKRLQQKEVVG